MMWTSQLKMMYSKMKIEVEVGLSEGLDSNTVIEGVMAKYNALDKEYTTDIYLLLNKVTKFYNEDRQRQKLKKEGKLVEVHIDRDIEDKVLAVADISTEKDFELVDEKIDAKVLIKKFKAIKKRIQKEKHKSITVMIKKYIDSNNNVDRGIAKKSLVRVVDKYNIKELLDKLLHNEYIKTEGLLRVV